MRLLLIGIFSIAVLGCQTTGGGGQSYAPPVTEDCRIARAEFQICYGTCLSSTSGTFLQAAGRCGNQCRRESLASQRACR